MIKTSRNSNVLNKWSAVYDNYDGAEDSSNRYHIGIGQTEREAMVDLIVNFGGEEFAEMPEEAVEAWVDAMLDERARDDYNDQMAERGKDIAKGIEER